MSDIITIKGQAFWASLQKINQMSEMYQIDISQLSQAAVKKLESVGVEVKHKDNQGFYITCKSKFKIPYTYEGDDDCTEVMGNGSEVIAVVSTYDWKFKNKSGVSCSLKKLTCTKRVDYVAADEGIPDDEPL